MIKSKLCLTAITTLLVLTPAMAAEKKTTPSIEDALMYLHYYSSPLPNKTPRIEIIVPPTIRTVTEIVLLQKNMRSVNVTYDSTGEEKKLSITLNYRYQYNRTLYDQNRKNPFWVSRLVLSFSLPPVDNCCSFSAENFERELKKHELFIKSEKPLKLEVNYFGYGHTEINDSSNSLGELTIYFTVLSVQEIE